MPYLGWREVIFEDTKSTGWTSGNLGTAYRPLAHARPLVPAGLFLI